MLSKRKQQNYFRERCDSMLAHFDHFARRTNADDLHGMRVELKKIKALLFLHNKTASREKANDKLLRKIFRRAGFVRDAQVSAHLVRNANNIPPSFFAERRRLVADEAKKLNKLVVSHAGKLNAIIAKNWKKFHAIPKSELRTIVNKLEKQIRKVFYPKLNVSALHGIRKKMKKVVYFSGLLKKKGNKLFTYDTQRIKYLAELIGKWHDTTLAAEVLGNHSTTRKIPARLKAGQKKQLAEIRKQAVFLK